MAATPRRIPGSTIGAISAVGGLALLACRPDPESIAFQLPTTNGDRSVVLALSDPDATTPIIAHALDLVEGRVPATDLLTRTLRSNEALELDVTALIYVQPLEALGIPAGALQPLPSGTPAASLPDPARMVAARLSGRALSDFKTPRERPAVLDVLYLRAPEAPTCADFEVRALPLGSLAQVTLLLGLGRGALIATAANELFFMTLADGARPLSGPTTTIFDAFETVTGELWLSAQGGQILRGHLEPEGCAQDPAVPCTRLATTLATVAPSREDLLWISGPSTESPRELFVLSRGGELSRLSRDEKKLESARFPSHHIGLGGLAWVGPQQAVAVLDPNEVAYRWNQGVIREEVPRRLLGQGTDILTAVAHLEGLGTLVGSYIGLIFLDSSGDAPLWLEAEVSRLNGATIRAIDPYEHGFVFLDASGRMTQYEPRRPDDPFCPWYLNAPGAPDAPDDVTVVGRDVVAAGAPAAGQTQNYVRWMVRRF